MKLYSIEETLLISLLVPLCVPNPLSAAVITLSFLFRCQRSQLDIFTPLETLPNTGYIWLP